MERKRGADSIQTEVLTKETCGKTTLAPMAMTKEGHLKTLAEIMASIFRSQKQSNENVASLAAKLPARLQDFKIS